MDKDTNIRNVFLCHASDDKSSFIRPFAMELKKHNISYWLDEAEIMWGDNIIQKVNSGLQASKYVIVFLSENFFKHNWPEAELATALSKENTEGKVVVLPILLTEDETTIFKRYPLLQGKKFVMWNEGISTIITQLKQRLSITTTTNIMQEDELKDGTNIAQKGYQGPSNLLKELISYGAMLPVLTNPKTQKDLVLHLLDRFCGIIMMKYGIPPKEGGIRNFQSLLNHLVDITNHDIPSGIAKNSFIQVLNTDLQRIGRSINYLIALINHISEINSDDIPSEKESRITSSLANLYSLSTALLSIAEPGPVVEIKNKLAEGEGKRIEFKSTMRWDLISQRREKKMEYEVAKALAGFMNSEGGTLFIGVDDHGNILGLDNDLRLVAKQDPDGFQRAFTDLVSNFLGGDKICEFIPEMKCTKIDEKLIFVVDVAAGSRPVYLAFMNDVEFCVRFGSSTRSLKINEAVDYIFMHWPLNSQQRWSS